MIDLRIDSVAALLSVGLLVLAGCDIAPPGYSPPGKNLEISGQVLWIDSFNEKPLFPLDPTEESCATDGLNLHASRLKGTKRRIIEGSSGGATDLALDQSARQAYWTTRTVTSPPCGPVKDVLRIKRVSLSDGHADTIREINNIELGGPDRTIPDLAVSGTHLTWVETTIETSVVLAAPLPTGEGALQPDTAYVTEGEVEALEAGPDGEAVYWNTQDDRLFRTRLGGATARLSESFSGEVEAIGRRPARIYWTYGSSLHSISLDGSDARQDGTVPAETTAMTIGPNGEKVFVGTEGEEEGIWVGSLPDPQASGFKKSVGEGKSGNRHREDFRTPRSLAVLYEEEQ